MFLQNVTDKGNVHGGFTHQESTITLLQVSQPYSPYYWTTLLVATLRVLCDSRS